MAEKRDVFGSYLETSQRVRGIRRPDQADQRAEPPADAKMKVISILAGQGSGQAEMSLQELQERAGLGFAEFGTAVAALERAGLVEVRGEPGREVSALTDSGRAFVQS